MSIPSILIEIEQECARQRQLWGEQNHRSAPDDMEHMKRVMDALEEARDSYPAKGEELFWWQILEEEVLEAMCETDEELVRTELIQVAAVTASWIECIDRRLKQQALQLAAKGPASKGT